CDRVARVRRRRRAMGRACRRTQDVRAFDERRSVGRGARGAAGGRWYRRGRTRYDRIGTASPTVSGARASARALAMIQPQQLVAPSLAGVDLSADPLSVVERQLLEPAGLGLADIDRALAELMTHRLDYGDLYFQSTRYVSWSVEDGNVKEGVFSVDQGVGVRAVAGEKTGFAYADQLDVASLLDAAAAARGIARSGGEGRVKVASRVRGHSLYPAVDPLPTLDDAKKVELLADLDRYCRKLDPRVIQVVGSIAGVYELVLIRTSEGVLAADVRPLVRLNVSVIVEHDGRREQGYAGGGGRGDLRSITAGDKPLAIAREAVRQAAVNMEAVPAPAGNMTVVLGSGWPGSLQIGRASCRA